MQQALQAAWNANDWPWAIEILQQIRTLTPQNPDTLEGLYRAHVNYGYTLLTHNDIDGARAQFNAALQVKPDGNEASRELQQLAVDPSLAYRVVSQLEGQYRAFAVAGNWPDAIRTLRQIQRIDPAYSDLNTKLAAAYTQYGDQPAAQGQAELAAEQYRQALAIQIGSNPPPAPALVLTATVPITLAMPEIAQAAPGPLHRPLPPRLHLPPH